MVNLFSKNYNKRTRFTRVCIGEAIFALMDKKEYKDIRISDIVKRAGVSRMTFYHYYESKEDALADFFHEIVAGYIRECISEKETIGKFHDITSIVHALKYFDRYAGFILKLVDAKLYYIVIDAMNAYMKNRIQPRYKLPLYELYFYGGALLNVFIMWELNGKKESAEEIAGMVADSIKSSERQ